MRFGELSMAGAVRICEWRRGFQRCQDCPLADPCAEFFGGRLELARGLGILECPGATMPLSELERICQRRVAVCREYSQDPCRMCDLAELCRCMRVYWPGGSLSDTLHMDRLCATEVNL